MAENREKLWRSCSCLYPNLEMDDLLSGQFVNHQDFFLQTDTAFKREKILTTIAYCKKNSIKNLVISAEMLFEREIELPFARELSQIPGVDLRVIVYLRRQDYWLESAWTQWGYKSKNYVDVHDYIIKRDCNWLGRVQMWEEAVGRERLVIRCYEKEQLPNGLISDFLGVIGIDYGSYSWIEQKDQYRGFKSEVMEILFLNKDFCIDENDNRLQVFFEEYFDESYQKQSFEGYSFISPKERIMILDKYAESNTLIAREYLKRDDGRLFYEPYPDPEAPWESYKGLTVEEFVPVFAYLVYNIDMKYRQQHKPFPRNVLECLCRWKTLGRPCVAIKRWFSERFNR